MKKLRFIGWIVRKFNVIQRWKDIRCSKGKAAAWDEHGYTVRTMDGGTFHCATYQDAVDTLNYLYETNISINTLRHALERNVPITARYHIATIKRRGEK